MEYIITFRYIGNEYAMVSLVKYDAEDQKIKLLPYYITSNFIAGNLILSIYLIDRHTLL